MKVTSLQWAKIPKQKIHKIKNNLYAIRIKKTVRIPDEEILFNNTNIRLTKYNINVKTTLGYVLYIKQNKLKIFENNYWLSLMNNVKKHYKANKVYEDQYICLYKFNNKNNSSYWLILRSRQCLT